MLINFLNGNETQTTPSLPNDRIFPADVPASPRPFRRDDIDVENLDVFDNVQVFGDMKGCNFHHNYYGMYSYGHQGGVWTDNKMHDNHVYGELDQSTLNMCVRVANAFTRECETSFSANVICRTADED